MTRPSQTIAAARLVHAAVAALFVAGVLGTVVAPENSSAAIALGWLTGGVVTYALVAWSAASPGRWRQVGYGVVAAAAIAAAYAVAQYRYLQFPDKVGLIVQLGETLSAWSPAFDLWRPFANTLATLLEGMLPLAVGLAVAGAPRSRRAAAGAGAVIALALLLSASRGAWLAEGFVAAVAAAAVWRRTGGSGRPIVPLAAGLLLAALTGLTLLAASEAFSPGGSPVDWLQRPDRQAIHGHALMLARDFPFTGVGMGDAFATALARHSLLIEVPFLTYAHHLWLDVWLELGVLGLLALTALAAAIVAGAVAGEKASLGPAFRGAYLGVFAVLFHGLSDWRPAVDGWTWLSLFALLGLMAARLGSRPAPRWAPAAMALSTSAAALAVAVWIWPLGAAWHVNRGGLAELSARLAGSSGVAALAAGEPHYRAALAIDPAQATAHRRLGILASARDDAATAVSHLEASFEAAPESWPTRKALGLAYVWAGRTADAELLLRSLAHDDEMVRELDTWSWWQEQRGRPRDALMAAEVGNRLSPSPQRAARLALLLRSSQPEARLR